MLTIGALSFMTPAILLGLLALPVLWWLLRVSPPAPRVVRFPALRLLLGLASEEETPARMPWWLMALRLLLAALVIAALAGPLWNAADRTPGTGALVLVVDNGWAAAPGWPKRMETLNGFLDEAERENRPVVLIPTATATPPTLDVLTARDARTQAANLKPQPYAPDRAALVDRLDALKRTLPGVTGTRAVAWLSDGLTYGAARDFGRALANLGAVTVLSEPNDRLALAFNRPETEGNRITIPVLRPRGSQGSARQGEAALLGTDGRVLGNASFRFEADETRTLAEWDLPLEVRNRAARFALGPADRSAGGVFLLDGNWRRKPTGVVSGDGTTSARPLLSDLYYLRRALVPYADLREGELGTLLDSGLSVLILSDVGQIVGPDRDRVGEWVDEGGVLIRFAGPRLARRSDDLLPVTIRRGGRALGGTLSWETPKGLAPFEDDSPFAGLPVSEEVIIERQVLAEPSPDLDARTWARLEDGTPLVTADRTGRGWMILIHVTANQDWSTLPLSGLYVEMLRRLIALSPGMPAAQGSSGFTGPYAPVRTLDGLGALGQPPAAVLALRAEDLNRAPDGRRQPGLYGREGGEIAYNVAPEEPAYRVMGGLEGDIATGRYEGASSLDLRAAALIAAFILGLIDLVASLALTGQTGGLNRLLRRSGEAGAAMILFALTAGTAGTVLAPTHALAQGNGDSAAQDSRALAATRVTHLAYVETGDAASDAMSRQGLEGLGQVIAARTAFESGPPVGVEPGRDPLVFYPLIYWRVTPGQGTLSPEGLRAIDTYMKNGGTILFDTADHGSAVGGLDATGLDTAQGALRALVQDLDIPPLVPVPDGHVLGKAFYLLTEFPGRYAGGEVWVQAPPPGTEGGADNPIATTPSRHDGVSPIIIGANDWASAWARGPRGAAVVAPVPGGERQRELAYRFGVNLVMYTLSGNYKADQVHVPAILERLGQ